MAEMIRFTDGQFYKAMHSLISRGFTDYDSIESRFDYSRDEINEECQRLFNKSLFQMKKSITEDLLVDFVMHSNWEVQEISFWLGKTCKWGCDAITRKTGKSITHYRKTKDAFYSNGRRIPPEMARLYRQGLVDHIKNCVLNGVNTNQEIAQGTDYSITTIQKMAKSITGMSLSQYVTWLQAGYMHDFILRSNWNKKEVSAFFSVSPRTINDILKAGGKTTYDGIKKKERRLRK